MLDKPKCRTTARFQLKCCLAFLRLHLLNYHLKWCGISVHARVRHKSKFGEFKFVLAMDLALATRTASDSDVSPHEM